jgi:hypothetical protein
MTDGELAYYRKQPDVVYEEITGDLPKDKQD